MAPSPLCLYSSATVTLMLVSRTVSTPRHTTRYIECGPVDGPPMIFLHGWPSISLMWHAQMDALAADGWHCVAPDLRGYDGSSAPAGSEAYTIREVVADMAELHDHAGGKPALWVGHDWGSVVAAELAAHEPRRSVGFKLPIASRRKRWQAISKPWSRPCSSAASCSRLRMDTSS